MPPFDMQFVFSIAEIRVFAFNSKIGKINLSEGEKTMTYTTQSRMGPEFTPKSIKTLILITCIVSIVVALLDIFLVEAFGIRGPFSYLSLSWPGLTHFFLWQPLTYLFTYGTNGAAIGLYWMLGLAINMYILWLMGSNISERVGETPFLRMYLFCGIAAGLIAALLMPIFGQYTALSGQAPAILAVLTVWVMLNPDSDLLLFFVLPVKARRLVIGAIGAIALVNLSNLNFIYLFFYISGALIGHLYGVVACIFRGPFPITHQVDSTLSRFAEKIRQLIPKSNDAAGKIFDIKTGKSVDADEKFMDQMLDKISKYGKDSLSWWEKSRMDKNSNKTNK